MTWRAEMAVEDYPYWLPDLEEKMTAEAAVRQAQNVLEGANIYVSWRVVKMPAEPFEKITDEHLFKIMAEGRVLHPWELLEKMTTEGAA